MSKKEKKQKKKPRYYINNNELVKEMRKCYSIDGCTDVMGQYIMKIVDGISHSPNFINYSYRDEMASDAIYRLIKTINDKGCKLVDEHLIGQILVDKNDEIVYEKDSEGEYKQDNEGNLIPCKITQSNVFGYLSMITWHAFVNRIKSEKKYCGMIDEYRDKMFEDFEIEYNIDNSQHGENLEDVNYE